MARHLAFTLRSLLLALTTSTTVPAQHSVLLADKPELLLSAQQDWGTLGFNVAAHLGGIEGQPLRVGDKAYAHGLGHHANGSFTVLLEGQFTAFDADVGIQPCAGGSVIFRVLVDGQERFSSGVLRSGDAPQSVHVEVGDAQEMVLEARDAGDGINCDMANWAEARLTPRTGGAATRPAAQAVDVARFARVATWDPNRLDGARADRVQEFRADDLFTETELKRRSDGTFTVPLTSSGVGCIGLQWLNRRALRELSLEFTGRDPLPSADSVRVEGWFGESVWQGGWKPLAGAVRAEGRRLVFGLGTGAGVVQTHKVRWVLPSLTRSPRVSLAAFTRSSWTKTNLVVQVEGARRGAQGRVAVWNGERVDEAGRVMPNHELAWELSRAVRLSVRYSRASSLNTDPTILNFQLPAGAVSVAVPDVLSNDCVYLPDYGLFVAREPSPTTVAEYQRRIAGRKSILAEVRTMPDQTLAQAMARTHHEFQREGPVMLSLACDNTKFIVERNGVVKFHPAPFQWLGQNEQVDWGPWYATSSELRAQFGASAKPDLNRRLDGGWLPIPVLTTDLEGIRYTQRAFVAPYGSGGSGAPFGVRKSVCVVEFSARNTLPNPANASLSLAFLAHARSNQPADLTLTSRGVLVSAGERPIAFVQSGNAETGKFQPDLSDGILRWIRALDVGETAQLVVYLPGEGLGTGDLSALGGAAELRASTEAYWRELLGGALQVETPDELLNNLVRSSQVRCLIDARSEAGGSRVGASIAAMAYGPLESEAHSVIRGMDYMGHPEFARRSFDFFLHRYSTNGFLTTGYTTFGTAWHLWTVGEHYQLTRDTNWLRQAAPELARACHWIVRQTQKTRRLAPAGQPVPEFGLMPPGVLADWNSFACHFAMNGYYCAALRHISAALRDLGHPDAALFAKQGEELRRNTLRAYAWTQTRSPALALRDGTWIPHYPSQVHSPGRLAEFFPGQDAGRSWCYDVELGAHQLVPAGVLAPGSREVQRLMDHMEDVQFLSDGWFDYPAPMNQADWFNLGGFSKVQPYYTRNCEIYALCDDVKPFVRSYFNSIASLLNPEVLTFWEHFHHSGAWDKTHETGYFLHQTRTMLVQERGDDLWLAPFITSNWLNDGQRVAARHAPTRFGNVDFEIRSHAARDEIEAHINPPSRTLPKSIVLRLRHPAGKTLRSVTLNGKRVKSFDAEKGTIVLKPSPSTSTVVAHY